MERRESKTRRRKRRAGQQRRRNSPQVKPPARSRQSATPGVGSLFGQHGIDVERAMAEKDSRPGMLKGSCFGRNDFSAEKAFFLPRERQAAAGKVPAPLL